VVLVTAALSARHLNADTPHLRELARGFGGVRTLRPSAPAVTCTSQGDLLTGQPPRHHGAVANGWMIAISAKCACGDSPTVCCKAPWCGKPHASDFPA
jgi:predicted AlkP superfamily pyrophosphatase or phosphodiesterase